MNNNNFPFKEGDWITDGQLTCKVLRATSNSYELHLYNDDYYHFETDAQSVNKGCHLWTIKDAQEGDVIATPNGNIFIFKCINSNGQIWDYCGIYNGTFYPKSGSPNGESIPECCKDYKLATLEQCNLLWQRMREAGYKWNSRTKEVVKAPFKLEGTLFSAADRGKIDEIIFALKSLEKDKMLCYAEEIKFLEKIRKL